MDILPFTRPQIDEETIAAVADVLRSGWLTTGPKCRELEAALSARAGGRPVRLVSSATAALEFALRIADIGPGDEVITTSLSWVATSNVILAVGATPVFIDIDPATRLIDLSLLEAALTARTRAIIPVDLAGFPVDRDQLYALAAKHKLRVIEDAAQSQGALWKGREIGSFGDLTALSFHPNKNMTTGEGGCLVMNNEDEARRFEKLRLQGVTRFPTSPISPPPSASASSSVSTASTRAGVNSRGSISRRSPDCRWACRRLILRTATGICSRCCCPRASPASAPK
jgi:dTDP-4-amino-4,6-dideoxygalactose transaminase